MALVSSLFGCGKTKPTDTSEPIEMPPAYVKEIPETPGKLVGIKREYSGGSMEWGTEFDIDINPNEIVSCAYWDHDSHKNEITRKEHVPITEEQWADIEKSVLDLWGEWEVIPESVLNSKPDPDIQILDGGDYERWWLSWETEEGTETYRYYSPGDRRILTVIELLREAAEPKGRKIEWYDPPGITGAYYSNDKSGFSFQCTPWDKKNNGYRLIVYFNGFAGDRIDDHVADDVWEQALPAFAWLDVKKFEDGSHNDKISLSLYYSDGSQKSLKLDKKSADIIEPYLRQLSLKYLEKK